MLTLGIVATIIGILGALPYIRDAYKRKVRPHRFAWLLFLIVSIINLTSQFALGARESLLFFSLFVVNNFIILGLSLRKGAGYGDISKINVFAFSLAILAIILWQTTNSPLLALICALAADAIGVLFIIVKAYKHPRSETMTIWASGVVASFLNLFAVGSLDPAILAAPVQVFVLGIAIVAAILIGRQQKHV